MSYGDKPYAIDQIVLTNAAGTVQVTLPAQQKLKFSIITKSAELENAYGELQALASRAVGVEWELEHGGISLEAVALITGGTVVTAGTTPNETKTLGGAIGTNYPYFKIYGKSLGDGTDDIHVKLNKCKLMEAIEGEFGNGEFFVTSCKGKAMQDASGDAFEIVQNETAANLPTS